MKKNPPDEKRGGEKEKSEGSADLPEGVRLPDKPVPKSQLEGNKWEQELKLKLDDILPPSPTSKLDEGIPLKKRKILFPIEAEGEEEKRGETVTAQTEGKVQDEQGGQSQSGAGRDPKHDGRALVGADQADQRGEHQRQVSQPHQGQAAAYGALDCLLCYEGRETKEYSDLHLTENSDITGYILECNQMKSFSVKKDCNDWEERERSMKPAKRNKKEENWRKMMKKRKHLEMEQTSKKYEAVCATRGLEVGRSTYMETPGGARVKLSKVMEKVSWTVQATAVDSGERVAMEITDATTLVKENKKKKV